MPSKDREAGSLYLGFHVHVYVLQKAKRRLFIHCRLNGKSGGHQASAEHRKVPKALDKDYWALGRVLVWGTSLQGRGTVLAAPRLPVAQCPTAQAVLCLGPGEEEEWGMAPERGTAC